MTSRRMPNIGIEKINLNRFDQFRDVLVDSGKEWFAAGMIPQATLSDDELDCMIRAFLVLWEKDDT